MFYANIEGDGRGNLAILKHGHLKIIEVLMNIGSINEKARVGVLTKESRLVTFEARIRQQIGNVRDAFVIGRVGCCGTNEEGLCVTKVLITGVGLGVEPRKYVAFHFTFDAISCCFSDIGVLRQGREHGRCIAYHVGEM